MKPYIEIDLPMAAVKICCVLNVRVIRDGNGRAVSVLDGPVFVYSRQGWFGPRRARCWTPKYYVPNCALFPNEGKEYSCKGHGLYLARRMIMIWIWVAVHLAREHFHVAGERNLRMIGFLGQRRSA